MSKKNVKLVSNQVGDQHQEGVNIIPTPETVDFHRDYAFTDLSFFKNDAFNRDSTTNDGTVKRYKKMMLNGEWVFEISPIWVGINTHTIANGFHRKLAYDEARAEGLDEVMYVRFFDDSKPEKRANLIKAFNSAKAWRVDAWCESRVAQGDPNFSFLKRFALDEDHPQLHGKSNNPYWNKAAIVLGLGYSGFKAAYETGAWNLEHDTVKNAEKTYEEMVRIKRSLRLDLTSQDEWITWGEAWIELKNDKNFQRDIKNLPNGIEDFYDALKFVDNTCVEFDPKTGKKIQKKKVWKCRFKEALAKAERHTIKYNDDLP